MKLYDTDVFIAAPTKARHWIVFWVRWFLFLAVFIFKTCFIIIIPSVSRFSCWCIRLAIYTKILYAFVCSPNMLLLILFVFVLLLLNGIVYMKSVVLWHMTPCSLVGCYWRLEGIIIIKIIIIIIGEYFPAKAEKWEIRWWWWWWWW